jgi:hypothetical protein
VLPLANNLLIYMFASNVQGLTLHTPCTPDFTQIRLAKRQLVESCL